MSYTENIQSDYIDLEKLEIMLRELDYKSLFVLLPLFMSVGDTLTQYIHEIQHMQDVLTDLDPERVISVTDGWEKPSSLIRQLDESLQRLKYLQQTPDRYLVKSKEEFIDKSGEKLFIQRGLCAIALLIAIGVIDAILITQNIRLKIFDMAIIPVGLMILSYVFYLGFQLHKNQLYNKKQLIRLQNQAFQFIDSSKE